MLQLDLGGEELYNEATCEFILTKSRIVQLEHSLYSLKKWESKWHKSFLETFGQGQLTAEQTADYVRCMTITPNVPKEAYDTLSPRVMAEINRYLEDPMTATTFSNKEKEGASGRHEVVTSEVIYYYMIEYGIPFECQKWNLNQLMTLIRVCQIKGQPQKTMRGRELMQNNAMLNAARRRQHHTRG